MITNLSNITLEILEFFVILTDFCVSTNITLFGSYFYNETQGEGQIK